MIFDECIFKYFFHENICSDCFLLIATAGLFLVDFSKASPDCNLTLSSITLGHLVAPNRLLDEY